MIEKDDLKIRRMEFSDFALMMKWLNDPQVLKFYEEPPSDLERIRQKYEPRIEGSHYVTPCIAMYKNQPIGYIQYYPIQEADLNTYGLDQNVYGIDQFIGDPGLWGKGIGTALIQLMLNHLGNESVSKVILEVKNNNIRAIKSYGKCGFQKAMDINSEMSLMEYIIM
ncbi:GNAT family N-acetyltransferase [Jeotgalibacillus terrae]|uniref:Lysine N-acyltransferase MbtK n=1 Tax=Jeotgalibacillus terrae TaxID=587735 RepID=A0ABW5ZH00_9BACL|nr:GNAT family N-acetyltransferase [Jeotgalibacillus terrae]MBM7578644.1 aminoglycoside 6'-N-acetyltransferase [Jeotgalibacillus terrae]